MHFTDTGSGVPLVLLHAFPLDSRMWDPVRDALSEVVRLITPDLRGFGKTPTGDAEPSVDTFGHDVIALLDELGIDRAVVGGCSMGGYAAMATVRAADERVSGLLLIDTKAPADTDEAAANRLAIAARAEAEGIVPWLADAMLPVLLADQSHAEPVRALIESQTGAGIAWAQRAMAARPDSRDTLRFTDVDTLVMHGELDKLMPVALAEELTELTGGALMTLPDAGHLPSIEMPDAFVSAVRPWLGKRG